MKGKGIFEVLKFVSEVMGEESIMDMLVKQNISEIKQAKKLYEAGELSQEDLSVYKTGELEMATKYRDGVLAFSDMEKFKAIPQEEKEKQIGLANELVSALESLPVPTLTKEEMDVISFKFHVDEGKKAFDNVVEECKTAPKHIKADLIRALTNILLDMKKTSIEAKKEGKYAPNKEMEEYSDATIQAMEIIVATLPMY